MDFGALPPEVNSGRMYTGPGSAPLRTASAAWNLLAAELDTAANQYQNTINVLADDDWRGPTSATMAAAVAPYIAWMSTTGAQAAQAASQSSAAATAYETAFALTVPPAEIAANRAQLAMLVATNVLGQNTPAIAANEAMYGYAGSSATAAKVTPFTQPPETANPAAQALQGSAVTQASSASTGAGVQSQLQQVLSAVPSSLNQLTSPITAAPAAPGDFGVLGQILNFLDGADGNSIGTFLNSSLVNGFVSAGYTSPAIIAPGVFSGLADINSLGPGDSAPGGAGVTGLVKPVPPPPPVSVPNVGVSVNTSGSTLVGRLSVPPTWTAAAQVANHSGVTYAGGGWTNAVGPTGGGTGAVPAGVPGFPGAPGTRSGGFGHGPRYGNRLTVMGRPLSGG